MVKFLKTLHPRIIDNPISLLWSRFFQSLPWQMQLRTQAEEMLYEGGLWNNMR